MAEKQHPLEDIAAQTLAMQALLYASGALDEADAADFDTLLGEDQRVRDALCRAAQYIQGCSGTEASYPDPAYRQRVRQRLGMKGGWLRGLCHRRAYRGHPAAWGALGAAAALAFVLLLPASLRRSSQPEVAQPASNQTVDDTELANEEAFIWAQMPRSDRLLKVHQEEARRKQRDGMHFRLAKMEEERSERITPADNKNRVDH